MIRTLVAHTAEVDDAQEALAQLEAQLDLAQNKRTQMVGIIACHYEFVLSGVVQAVCEGLPFDIVGTTTAGQGVPGGAGDLMLTLMVLTSDDVRFATAVTGSLRGDPHGAITTAYETAARGEKPALILTFAPFLMENMGDDYVQALTEASGGAPCFGTLAVDDTPDFRNCFMLRGGVQYSEEMGLLLVFGDIHPRFFIATISNDKIIGREARITSSERHILKELNGRPVADYFADLGLTQASETSYGMTSVPFMLDYNDGTPWVSKVFITLTPEGWAVCAGAMPEGASFYMGVFDKGDVLATTRATIDAALQSAPGASGVLVYSCISRLMSLGADRSAEVELLESACGGRLPFMLAYSGGEVCPTVVDEHRAINRFHNNAFVLCIF